VTASGLAHRVRVARFAKSFYAHSRSKMCCSRRLADGRESSEVLANLTCVTESRKVQMRNEKLMTIND